MSKLFTKARSFASQYHLGVVAYLSLGVGAYRVSSYDRERSTIIANQEKHISHLLLEAKHKDRLLERNNEQLEAIRAELHRAQLRAAFRGAQDKTFESKN